MKMVNCSSSRILLKCLTFIVILWSSTTRAQFRNRDRDRDHRDRDYRDRPNNYNKFRDRDHLNVNHHHQVPHPHADDDYRDHHVNVPSNSKTRQNVDPCHSSYHRVISNEPRRSYNYRFGSGGPREHALCDRDLVAGWYRFHSLAGDNIPTSCPGVNYCGTRAPVWMKGTIPSVEEGIVKATACVSVQGKCCTTQIPILVRNCTDFTVYHLQPTPACPSAYCAGYEVTCPNGLASDTGYTPCHFPVDLLETKVSYGLSKDKTEIQFFCDVTLGGQVVPDTVGLEVEWLADDEVIQSETFGLLQQHKGVLKEEKWSIGQTLQCRARAKHMTINTFTAPQLSKSINTGVLVLSSQTLTATEGSDPAYIEFQTTIPIVCPKKEKPKKTEKKQQNNNQNQNNNNENKEKDKKEEEVEEEDECCVTFEISTSLASSSTPRCASGNSFDMVVTNACTYKVCGDEWNSTHKIPIWAVNDGLFGGDHDSDENQPTVLVEIRTTETSPPRWQEISLPTQEIQIQQSDITEQCISNNYIKTFDGILYENTFEGTFVLYKHSAMPYEVQIYRKRCTHSKLCNCGVAVRFGDVMIAADVCTTGKLRFWSYTLDGNYIEPSKIAHLPQIIRLDEGRSFQIQFPTGTKLHLGPNLRFVSIQASLGDLEHTSGLCGSFDRDPTNEFSTYKGQIVCQAYNNRTNDCPDFAKSWRLLTEQSLFVGSFTNDGHTEEDDTNLEDVPSPGHCSCSGLKKSTDDLDLRPKSKPGYTSPYEEYQPEGEQNPDENAAETNKCSSAQCVDPRGVEITTTFIDLLAEDDFIYEGEEFGTEAETASIQPIFYGLSKLNLQLDNESKITEDAAEVYCRGVIEGMSVTKLCRDVANIDVESHIKSCQKEVIHTKSTIWSFDSLEELRTDCKFQIYHNLSTWEPQLGRQHGTPPLGILSNLCLNNCSYSGVCEHGSCRCKKGFSGSDCSVSTGAAPKLTGLGFKPTCDIRNKACSEILVWGERFAETESIKCHVDVYTTSSAKSVPTLSTTLTTNGKLLTFQSVICDIPDLPVHDAKIASFYIPGEGLEKTRALLRIRVSYGSPSTSSDPLDYTIYDSLCWNCETALGCEARPTQSCNVLSEPFGSSNDPFQTIPSFSTPSVGFAHSNSPLQFSPDTSLGFSPSSIRQQNRHDTHHPTDGHGQPHPGLTEPCRLPKDSGPCRNDNLRYFFDTEVSKCRPFIYGGCQGNVNNFLSENDCLAACSEGDDHGDGDDDEEGGDGGTNVSSSSPAVRNNQHVASPSTIPMGGKVTLKRPDKCLLGNSPGPCDGEDVRYYFDTLVMKCRPFIFSGCHGNENNFETKEICIRECELLSNV